MSESDTHRSLAAEYLAVASLHDGGYLDHGKPDPVALLVEDGAHATYGDRQAIIGERIVWDWWRADAHPFKVR